MKTRTRRHGKRRSRRSHRRRRVQKAGTMPSEFNSLVRNPNFPEMDRDTLFFLSKKLDHFMKEIHTPNKWTEGKVAIATAIRQIMRVISSYYMSAYPLSVYKSPELLNALGYLFDEIKADFKERLERPAKSCVLLPGKFGKPKACPDRNSGTLEACKNEVKPLLHEASSLRNLIETSADAFFEKTIQFFRAVQSSAACTSFERIDNFAQNKGKATKGNIQLFEMMVEFYNKETLYGLPPAYKNPLNANRVETNSNASSVTASSVESIY
jgi:hypothetical protein